MNNNSTNNDFFSTKSFTEFKLRKKPTYGVEGIEIPYKPFKGEEEWIDKELDEQVTSTISSVKSKKLKDDDIVYVVLGLSTSYTPRKYGKSPVRVFSTQVKNVLKRLSAEILGYLNTEHNRLLLSVPLSNLSRMLESKRKFNLKYFHNVKRLSPLTFKEQVSSDLLIDENWKNETKSLLIQLIPNLSSDKRNTYQLEIINYLKEHNADPIDVNDAGFIIANLSKDSTNDLLNTSNFIFNVTKVPEGIAEAFVNSIPDSINEPNHKLPRNELNNLPIICLMDSGLNDIDPLNGLVLTKDGYRFKGDFGDGAKNDGHGTPIAVLAAYDENLEFPIARIISYKIFSEQRKLLYINAYIQALAKYSNQTRIFLSSINFTRSNPYLTSELDKLIQAYNICVILSAGNIHDKNKILKYSSTSTACSEYVLNHPIEDPASAVNIVAVGAISKTESSESISRINELSPFTTCGVDNSLLHSCPKPEVVQNGGNYCKNNTCLGLVSYDKFGHKVDKFVGTSFAAPLFARNIAQIEAKYGKKIRNAETLKAIALASAERADHICKGFGETMPFTTCDNAHALVFSEGKIPLDDRVSIKGFYKKTKGIIKVKIPTGVCKIELFIVHSDNNYLTAVPCLNTHLKVRAYKEGNESSSVTLDNPEVMVQKSHMKVFRWCFTRTSMQGIWTFHIIPEKTVDLLPEHEKDTTVRYGCAILLTSRSTNRFIPLSQELGFSNNELER